MLARLPVEKSLKPSTFFSPVVREAVGHPSDKALTYNLATQTDLLATVEAVKRCGVNAVPILADVTSYTDCERMAAETVKQLGTIDVVESVKCSKDRARC